MAIIAGLLRRMLVITVTIALVGLVWWAATSIWDVPTYLIPPPSEVWTALTTSSSFFLTNARVTATEILLGLAVATGAAVAWAALIVSVDIVRKAVFPLMVVAQSAPKEALAPIFIIWWGFSATPKIVMASLIAFFPILVATVVGLERFTREQQLLASSMGAGPLRRFFSFRIWVALPSFLSGIRLGVTLAAIGAVLGEYLGSDKGLGYMIVTSARQLNGGFLYGALISLMIMCWAMVRAVDVAELLLLRGTRAGKGF
ncbi:MAG: NitT/TauT family transport system permease protein [Actinomycetota bacterium]|nr:NitT/TauT family transport system permease protein [Actinomycetota bacterium]